MHSVSALTDPCMLALLISPDNRLGNPSSWDAKLERLANLEPREGRFARQGPHGGAGANSAALTAPAAHALWYRTDRYAEGRSACALDTLNSSTGENSSVGSRLQRLPR